MEAKQYFYDYTELMRYLVMTIKEENGILNTPQPKVHISIEILLISSMTKCIRIKVEPIIRPSLQDRPEKEREIISSNKSACNLSKL